MLEFCLHVHFCPIELFAVFCTLLTDWLILQTPTFGVYIVTIMMYNFLDFKSSVLCLNLRSLLFFAILTRADQGICKRGGAGHSCSFYLPLFSPFPLFLLSPPH